MGSCFYQFYNATVRQSLPQMGRFSLQISKPSSLFSTPVYHLPCNCLSSSANTVSFFAIRKFSFLRGINFLRGAQLLFVFSLFSQFLPIYSNCVISGQELRIAVVGERSQCFIRRMSDSATPLSVGMETVIEGVGAQQIELLTGEEDTYDGVTVHMEESMAAEDFASKLRASLSKWKQEGKKGIWIKLPLRLANLVETAVKEGFRYHHAEPDYLMLVTWISESPDTIPANASHRVGVGAFVLRTNGEMLTVQEGSGYFKDKNVWKLPTGVVNQGEDMHMAAIREVKEETGVDTEFVEILAFRQSHKSFHGKSDMFFLCLLRPCSYEIQKQDLEITAAQWMPVEDYVKQPFIQEKDLLRDMAIICLKKSKNEYSGFSPMSTTSTSGKTSYFYCSNSHAEQLILTRDQQTNSS